MKCYPIRHNHHNTRGLPHRFTPTHADDDVCEEAIMESMLKAWGMPQDVINSFRGKNIIVLIIQLIVILLIYHINRKNMSEMIVKM